MESEKYNPLVLFCIAMAQIAMAQYYSQYLVIANALFWLTIATVIILFQWHENRSTK